MEDAEVLYSDTRVTISLPSSSRTMVGPLSKSHTSSYSDCLPMFHSSLLFAYIFSHFVNVDACNLGVLAVKDFGNLL